MQTTVNTQLEYAVKELIWNIQEYPLQEMFRALMYASLERPGEMDIRERSDALFDIHEFEDFIKACLDYSNNSRTTLNLDEFKQSEFYLSPKEFLQDLYNYHSLWSGSQGLSPNERYKYLNLCKQAIKVVNLL